MIYHRIKKKRKELLLLICTIIFFFLCFEAVLRIFYPLEKDVSYKPGLNYYGSIFKLTGNPLRPWVLIPGAVSNIYEIEYKINSKGLRDYEYDYKKPEGVYRIVVLGDSVTMGSGVNFEDMYSKQLEVLLNNNNKKKYEVINLGVAGYQTRHEFEHLKEEGIKYNPDMIIFGYTLGDVEEDLSKTVEAWGIVKKSFNNTKETLERVEILKSKFCIISFTNIKLPCKVIDNLRKIRVFTFIKYRWNDIQVKRTFIDWYHDMYYKRGSVDNLNSVFLEISQFSKDEKIPVLFIIFPYLSSDYKDYPYYDIHKAVTSKMEGYNISYIDLLDSYKKFSTPLYIAKIDPVHPNREGHRIAAEVIFENLFSQHVSQ